MPRAGIGNQTGQAYAFMAMTPIKPGEEDALAPIPALVDAEGDATFEVKPAE